MRPLAAALLLVALVGAVRVAPVRGLSHDGAIGMLAAAGRQADYYADPPTARWTDAATWQARWTPRPADAMHASTLRQIGTGLGERDIHPPLSFWALHAWLSATGHTPRAAAVLGLMALLTAVALVAGLGVRSGADATTAAAAAALWGLTGAALDAVLEPRPYVWVAALSGGLVWLLLGVRERPTVVRFLGLGVVGVAALLTHYHLALVGAVAGLFVAVPLVRSRPATAGAVAAIGVAALAAATVVHPYLTDALGRTGAGSPDAADILKRLALVAAAPVRMLLPVGPEVVPPPRALLAAWAVVGVVLGAAGAAWAERRRVRRPPMAVVIGTVTFAVVAALFVGGVTPLHSMDPRYGLLVSPLLAAGISGWVAPRTAGRRMWPIVALFAVAALVAPRRAVDRLPPLAGDAPVVVDTSSVGFVMPLLRDLRPVTPVWVGRPLPTVSSADTLVRVVTGEASPDAPDGWHEVDVRRVPGGTAHRWAREGSPVSP